MDDLRGRLARCFKAAIPKYKGDIGQLHPAAAEGWDSLATITLLTVVQEEFDIEIPADDLEHFDSFQNAERYISGRVRDSRRT